VLTLDKGDWKIGVPLPRIAGCVDLHRDGILLALSVVLVIVFAAVAPRPEARWLWTEVWWINRIHDIDDIVLAFEPPPQIIRFTVGEGLE
jgi:hypothetical protein